MCFSWDTCNRNPKAERTSLCIKGSQMFCFFSPDSVSETRIKTMGNTTAAMTFIMLEYTQMEELKYLHFFVFLLLYIIILFVSLVLIAVISTERALHQPRYFHVCNLVANGMYGITGLLPAVLHLLISKGHEISLSCTSILLAHVRHCWIYQFGSDGLWQICCHLLPSTLSQPYVTFKNYKINCIFLDLSLLCFSHVFLTDAPTNILREAYTESVLCQLWIGQAFLFWFAYDQCCWAGIDHFFYSPPAVHDTFFLFTNTQNLRTVIQRVPDESPPDMLSSPIVSDNLFNRILFWDWPKPVQHESRTPETRIFMSLYFILFPPMLNPVIYGLTIHAIRMRLFEMSRIKNKVTLSPR